MLAIYTFIPIFAPAIRLLLPIANGLVAQLNSALDYGSRGYWFESSQGHKTPTDVGVFLCFKIKKLPKNNIVRIIVAKIYRDTNIYFKHTIVGTISPSKKCT